MFKILVINPGSTSTKIAYYEEGEEKYKANLEHLAEELSGFSSIYDQLPVRKRAVMQVLEQWAVSLGDLDIIMARGGLIKAISSGIYEVNEAMREDLRQGVSGHHASNLGGLLAHELALVGGLSAYIADPVVVDEMEDIARFSGHPKLSRTSIFHALNHKSIARSYARSVSGDYSRMNLVIAHLGGGISVAAHKKGRVVDVNQALDGEGPFAPERSGSLPVGPLLRLCLSGDYSSKDLLEMVTGKGGVMAYLNTNSGKELDEMAENGYELARQVREAMGYQVAKEIGAMSIVFKGELEAILITGGLAFSEALVAIIRERVAHLAPVFVYPGEDELRALAFNGLLLLRGELLAKEYS